MKIRFWRHNLQLARTWTIARGSASSVTVLLVELGAAAGDTGVGEASPISRYGESVETVEAFIRRVDANRLSFEDVAGSTAHLSSLSLGDMAAKCALNIALVDGAAKQARMSLSDHLGLGFREHKHVTSFSIGIDKPEVIREKVTAASQFPVLKLKVGVPDDHLVLAALRDVSRRKAVRVDANEGWAIKEEALRRIEVL